MRTESSNVRPPGSVNIQIATLSSEGNLRNNLNSVGVVGSSFSSREVGAVVETEVSVKLVRGGRCRVHQQRTRCVICRGCKNRSRERTNSSDLQPPRGRIWTLVSTRIQFRMHHKLCFDEWPSLDTTLFSLLKR